MPKLSHPKPFTFISTFAGIGGIDLGLERSGMISEAYVEKDPRCRALLADKFPGAKSFDDIQEFYYYGQSVDLISGGFPCQDVSIAGKRTGLAGSRSGLYFHFERIIEGYQPRYFLIENVPGLLSSNGGRDFATILYRMGKLGYSMAWRILDAQYIGVPQRRRRVFIVGSLGNGCAAKVLLEREGLFRDPKKGREEREEAPGSIGADASGGDREGIESRRVAPTLNADGGGSARAGCQGNEIDFYIPAIASTLQSAHARNNKDDTFIWDESQISRPNNRSTLSNKSFTLNHNGRMMKGLRRLTPTECERLQGFPDGWTAGFPDTKRYHMLGNAVAVPVAEWIAKRILQADQGLL